VAGPGLACMPKKACKLRCLLPFPPPPPLAGSAEVSLCLFWPLSPFPPCHSDDDGGGENAGCGCCSRNVCCPPRCCFPGMLPPWWLLLGLAWPGLAAALQQDGCFPDACCFPGACCCWRCCAAPVAPSGFEQWPLGPALAALAACSWSQIRCCSARSIHDNTSLVACSSGQPSRLPSFCLWCCCECGCVPCLPASCLCCCTFGCRGSGLMPSCCLRCCAHAASDG